MNALTQSFRTQWLKTEIERLYPEECAGLGRKGVSRLVADAVRRATGYGFTHHDHLSYLALEMCFGESFIEKQEFAWARTAMQGPAAGKMQRLRRAAIFHLAALAEREERQKVADREAEEQARG